MAITKKQLESTINDWLQLDNTLKGVTLSAKSSLMEIQKQVATKLSTIPKRQAFCLFLEYQFKVDKKVNARLQNCINKPQTQRYLLKVKDGEPLTQKMSIRTASKELLKHKLNGKAIVDQKMIDKKGVYHAFKYDIPKAKKPTQISASQKVVTDFSMTKVQYIANAEKLTFVTVD